MLDSGVLLDKTEKKRSIVATGARQENLKRIYRNRVNGDWLDEAAEEHVKERVKNKQKFENLVKNSASILFHTKTMFPFDIFPDELIINPVKVSIVSKDFFRSLRIHCIYIKNILDVFLESGPIFATLRIVDQSFTENTVSVPHLKRSDALKARKLIQGLIVAHKQEVDITNLYDERLTEKLEALGNAEYTW